MTEALLPGLSLMFGIGLLGAGHCIGMCGGIASALGFAGPTAEGKGSWALIWAYSLGRIFSYACAGGLVASLGYASSSYLALGPVLRGIAGVLLISMGLYLAGWWRGLIWLEKGGNVLWRRLQPLSKGLLPVRSVYGAVSLGLLWGWLPCGLVYSALAYTATAATPLTGMVQMAAFGLGTMPAIVLGGLSMNKFAHLLQSKNLRSVFAILLIAYGFWTLLAPVWMRHEYH